MYARYDNRRYMYVWYVVDLNLHVHFHSTSSLPLIDRSGEKKIQDHAQGFTWGAIHFP